MLSAAETSLGMSDPLSLQGERARVRVPRASPLGEAAAPRRGG